MEFLEDLSILLNSYDVEISYWTDLCDQSIDFNFPDRSEVSFDSSVTWSCVRAKMKANG